MITVHGTYHGFNKEEWRSELLLTLPSLLQLLKHKGEIFSVSNSPQQELNNMPHSYETLNRQQNDGYEQPVTARGIQNGYDDVEETMHRTVGGRSDGVSKA